MAEMTYPADELLDVYDLNGEFLGVQPRNRFYDEAREEWGRTGTITRKVKTIRLLLMNSDGRIYLQKRSRLKSENGGLYDKTVGGHVYSGQTHDLTIIRECAEELGFAAANLPPSDYRDALRTIDLHIIGVVRQVDLVETYISQRATPAGVFAQPLLNAFYVGYYDGAIRFADGEASGIEVFSLDELEERLRTEPDRFTNDLRDFITRYRAFLVPARDVAPERGGG